MNRSPSIVSPQCLLLDFDGVIADSIDECRAVTWYSDIPAPDANLGELITQIPSWFGDRFDELRPFARTLDDFYVAKALPPTRRIASQLQFDDAKGEIPETQLRSFATSATDLRRTWQESDRQGWLRTHTIYKGIPQLLDRYSGRAYVITAKDADSATEVLAAHGLNDDVAGVVGDVSDKALAAICICLGRGVAPKDALFIDDNLVNVQRVQSAGVPARWADWGWTSPEHARQATDASIEAFSLVGCATL